MINFYGAIAAVLAAWLVMAIVTPFTSAEARERAAGPRLRHARPQRPDVAEASQVRVWWESPKVLGVTALGITLVLSLIFR